ncbi:MAG: KH domain-containing protein [Candidatus Gracilibacteria bacterium]|nr:KH domain-containing protein [Candidatus Gracilibacteria bacterium]
MDEVKFLNFIVENIVSNKDGIKIEKTDDELGTLLTLSVDKEDMGSIIGKGGNNINSIRSILRLYGVKSNKRINLKVLD